MILETKQVLDALKHSRKWSKPFLEFFESVQLIGPDHIQVEDERPVNSVIPLPAHANSPTEESN